ncbi:hypothetical protein RD792_006521 [Penstemon davidsonii]|uniref:Transcription factor CBF/NF-Y/archaeal histone domain-containing protein n=1 Tax=Penstemon davidsonii TaxID=160366 RepID=A0ABR0DD85_9LAMI|nr:hypothetical protein RD792_006521 [Penstemon davidsonii]
MTALDSIGQEVVDDDITNANNVANLTRIMHRALPPHAKISDDAKEAIQHCASEFIYFITSEANEKCQDEHRRTITPEDVLSAMEALGFDDYKEPLDLFLNKHRMQASMHDQQPGQHKDKDGSL